MGLRGGDSASSAWLDTRWLCGIRHMAGMPVTHGAQVGFPSRPDAIQQPPDYVLAALNLKRRSKAVGDGSVG